MKTEVFRSQKSNYKEKGKKRNREEKIEKLMNTMIDRGDECTRGK